MYSIVLSNSRFIASIRLCSNVGRDVLDIPIISRHLFCMDCKSSAKYCGRPPQICDANSKNCQKCTIPRVFPWVSLGSTPGKANDKCIMHGQFHALTVLNYPCHTQTFIASSFKILIIIGKNLSQSIKVNIHVLVMPC